MSFVQGRPTRRSSDCPALETPFVNDRKQNVEEHSTERDIEQDGESDRRTRPTVPPPALLRRSQLPAPPEFEGDET